MTKKATRARAGSFSTFCMPKLSKRYSKKQILMQQSACAGIYFLQKKAEVQARAVFLKEMQTRKKNDRAPLIVFWSLWPGASLYFQMKACLFLMMRIFMEVKATNKT